MVVLVIRTVLLFALVIFAVRIMGKRQLGEMQASEVVVTLIVSNVAAIPMQDVGIPLLTGIMPILTLVLLEVCLSYLMMKNGGLRHFITGKPVVVIAKGEVDQKAMRAIRFSNEDLFEEMRKNGVFDIGSVEYAVVETDGTLSILEKVPQPESTTTLYALVISDGKKEKHSLDLVSWTEKELMAVLGKEKTVMEDVYMMLASEDRKYKIVRKEK